MITCHFTGRRECSFKISDDDADVMLEERKAHKNEAGEWIMPRWPVNDDEWCAWYRALNKREGSDQNDVPLGHNYRCPIHGSDRRRLRHSRTTEMIHASF